MKLSAGHTKDHELVLRDATREEFCHRAALKIAQKTAHKNQVVKVTRRYDRIAEALWCLRPKPLSKAQIAHSKRLRAEFARGANWTEMKEDLNLAKRLRTKLTPDKREAIERGRQELWERIETRRRAVLVKYMRARRASGDLPNIAGHLLKLMKKHSHASIRSRLWRIIRRYLFAKVNGASWVIPLTSVDLLSQEWLRDEKALWKFLSACLECWNDLVNNPKSKLRRKIIIHHAVKSTGHDSKSIQTCLQEIKILPVVGSDKFFFQQNLINQHLSRDVSKARTKRRRI